MPLTLDAFNTDAFTTASLTAAINLQEYVPGYLGSLGLFEAVPVATTSVWVEERADVLTLVQNIPRGGEPPLNSQASRKRVARNFQLTHLVKADQVMADELQNVRAFGSQSDLQVLQQIVTQRMAEMRRDVEMTWEDMMLGCIQGTIKDAADVDIYNLFTEFGVSQESEVDFDLDNASPASGVVRQTCVGVVRSILRNLKGAVPATVRIYGLCGDTFWDQLIAHSEVRDTYKYHAGAVDLRGGAAWEEFTFGGITFTNYRGTNDNSTLLQTATKCNLFPVGVPGLFKMHYGPADKMGWVNTLGLPFYAFQYEDEKDRYRELEVQSNPLPLCTQPKVLMLAKNT